MFEIEWIPKKSVYRNLVLVKGVSNTLALKICAFLGISPNSLYSAILPHKVDQLNHLMSILRKKTKPFLIFEENTRFNPILGNLEGFTKSNVKFQVEINSLRGKRIKQGYPVRGQRTRTNGRTAKRINRSFFL